MPVCQGVFKMHKFTKQMKTHFLPLIILISLELATDPWGVHVDRVEIKDVRLPQQMQVGEGNKGSSSA